MPIHHSNPKCSVCGARHGEGLKECRDQLLLLIRQARTTLMASPEIRDSDSIDEVHELNEAVCDVCCLLEEAATEGGV